ncbi:hypothetical protein [Microbacterium sp. CIAB417]|uniref:hypothetical protein n=1 Tax=Microbacterium sp. CIAB417 TaxID=2860287 RepID=UPI001FAC8DCA|nr:hypothetical protein [Microbacterium sp. CIAB417]
MKRSITTVLVGAALLMAGAVAAPMAAAADDRIEPDPQIAAMLEAVPGGVVLDAYNAVWPELDMEMTVEPARPSGLAERSSVTALSSVGACASGKVCAFSLSGTNGSKLSWGTCNTSFPVGTFTVRSIADARSSGYAQAKYGTTVRATAYAGGWKNVYGSVSRITCVS